MKSKGHKKENDLKKVPIMDMFEQLISSGETESILDAIRKERGEEKTIDNKVEELLKRQEVLNKLHSSKGKEKK